MITIKTEKPARVERLALPTSSSQTRPSAADLHPDDETRNVERGGRNEDRLKAELPTGIQHSAIKWRSRKESHLHLRC
jgi:hypothetical protein